MEQSIALDHKAFKALSAKTRIDILKLLLKRNHLQSEIAMVLGLSPPTVKEHMEEIGRAHV
jgi:DNA-binding transcriptional ArsR family regulator